MCDDDCGILVQLTAGYVFSDRILSKLRIRIDTSNRKNADEQ